MEKVSEAVKGPVQRFDSAIGDVRRSLQGVGRLDTEVGDAVQVLAEARAEVSRLQSESRAVGIELNQGIDAAVVCLQAFKVTIPPEESPGE